MRTVGHRKARPIALMGSAALLAERARFNEEIHQLPTGNSFQGSLPLQDARKGQSPRSGVHRGRDGTDCYGTVAALVTEEHSRPATLEDLKALIRSLNNQDANYLLIGGYALLVHGYHRSTTDIDVPVPATQEAGRSVRDALMVLPDRAAKDLNPAWFVEGENIRVADAFVVDIMLNAAGETYDPLKQHAESIDFDGLLIRAVISCFGNRIPGDVPNPMSPSSGQSGS